MPSRAINDDRSAISLCVEEQVAYFVKAGKTPAQLVEDSTDMVVRGSRVFRGNKFPLSLILEALRSLREHCGVSRLHFLEEYLAELLLVDFQKTGFNYFDGPLVPDDLDTASMSARLLGNYDQRVIEAYDAVVARNRNSAGLVPTWLDTVEYERFKSGPSPFHVDVMLNHCITEAYLGRMPPLPALEVLIDARGLANYWYLPASYSTYLLARLVSMMADRGVTARIVDLIKRQRMDVFREANSCPYVEVREVALLHSKGPVEPFFRYALQRMLGVEVSVGRRHASEMSTHGESRWTAPLYWSAGFQLFGSEPVNRALALMCLVDS